MKRYLETRNRKILSAYDKLRHEGWNSDDAIEKIQYDSALNPTELSFDYIRRFIVFGKSDKISLNQTSRGGKLQA